MPKKLLIVA